MKRRGFLKSLVAAIVLSPLVCRIAEKVETVQEPAKTVCLNPAWESAPYEVCYVYHGEFMDRHDPDEIKNPPRYNYVNGEFVRVDKYL